jgi:hypothetical protein
MRNRMANQCYYLLAHQGLGPREGLRVLTQFSAHWTARVVHKVVLSADPAVRITGVPNHTSHEGLVMALE